MKRLLPLLTLTFLVALSGVTTAFQTRPGYFSTITGTSTSATALKLAGGVTAGSGAVGIVSTTGKIPALTATYFTSVAFDAANLTGTIPNAVQDNITRTGIVVSGTWSGLFGAVTGANLTNLTAGNVVGRIVTANLPLVVVAATSANTATGTVSATDSVATTLFTTSAATGLYEVLAYITDAGAIYTANAKVMCDNTNCRITADNGAGMALTLSGTSVQATQTTGSTQTITWSYLRIK